MKRSEGKGSASSKGRGHQAAIAIGTFALAAALLSYGLVTSCSTEEEPQIEPETAPQQSEAQTHQSLFFGTENWTFMSDDTMQRFQEEFYAWLLESEGLEDGAYVYLHSEEIACVDGVWSAYARTPLDDAYYKVTFDPQSKEITYQEVLRPSFANKPAEAREEIAASVAEQDEQDQPNVRNASNNIPVDDVSALSALMPKAAAESLSRIVSEYAATKGIQTSSALCSVYPESVSTSSGTTTLEVLIYDAQKNGYVIKADYDSASDRFGMSMTQL